MIKNIAILGFGVVGAGAAEVLEGCAEVTEKKFGFSCKVKHILDLRDFPDSPYGDRVVHDIGVILNDPEVELVIETMGGSHPALEFSLAAMNAGKHVVTSNKEVVSVHGLELLECAEKNDVCYMFEASVGGGIPIIHTIDTSLTQNEITQVCGILNGTTNYILTQMNTCGRDFADVLAEAQKLGYAEADPSADVDGIDACRKISILSALAYGKLIKPESINTTGIRMITKAEVAAAEKIGAAIKLIGISYVNDGKICAYVSPMAVKTNDPLYTVNDVFNGIRLKGDVVGDVMLYGRGAGRYPTASAVASDVLNILSDNGVKYKWVRAEENDVSDFKLAKASRLVLTDKDADIALTKIADGVYTTPEVDEIELDAIIQELAKNGVKVTSTLRILDR